MEYMAFAPRPRMDPPPRSFAPRCACMHHGTGPDRPTEYKSATRYRVQGGLASELVLMPPPASSRRHLKPAAGLATVKGCVAARWPAATLDRRSARAAQPA
jgi:hypothetical protein